MLIKSLTVSALALTSAAIAQDVLPATDIEEVVAIQADAQIDANAEASIQTPEELSLEDVNGMTEEAFATADADANGELTQDEFVTLTAAISSEEILTTEPTAAQFLVAKFEAIAKERATVTKEEIDTSVSQDFAAADSDGDQTLKGDEIINFEARILGQML